MKAAVVLVCAFSLQDVFCSRMPEGRIFYFLLFFTLKHNLAQEAVFIC